MNLTSPPLSFTVVCSNFFADIYPYLKTFERMAEFAVRNLRSDLLAELDTFLTEVLHDASDASDAELQDLWNHSPADVFVPDTKNLRAILAALQLEAQRRMAEEARTPR